MRRNDAATYELYRRKFPAIEQIPILGMANDGTLSAEKIIATKPDLAVLSLSVVPDAAASTLVQQLLAAEIPVVFTDFFVDPFVHTVPSIRLLGQVTGSEKQAEAYIAFYEDHMNRIASRLAQQRTAKPKILVEAHAGMAGCCFSPGRGNIGDYIAFAGGHSIAADVLPGPTGQLSLEYVIAQDPDVYVATGGPHLAAKGGFVVGPGIDDAMMQKSLSDVVRRPGITSLRAVRSGRAHGLFHNLLTTPLNILATEMLAKWINPTLFADLDVEKTKNEMNERFLAVPMQGTYWTTLQ
ncbi:MAG: ABC transporter substrate-binding protein [Pseudorhodoplanes sp.]